MNNKINEIIEIIEIICVIVICLIIFYWLYCKHWTIAILVTAITIGNIVSYN